MKYIHHFETRSQYTTARAAALDSDPWVSYLDSDDLLTYSPALNIEAAANGYEFVDLGLPSGTLWATCNVGAYSPEQSGGYYSWGETETKSGDRSWETYAFGPSDNSPSKYNVADGLTTLELIDDAAHVNMGGNWRMPTLSEMTELVQQTSISEDTVNGIGGKRFTGQNNNSIFIPETGNYWESTFASGGLMLWSSSLSNLKYSAMFLIGTSSMVANKDQRCYAHPVRGVFKTSRRWYGELKL